MASIVTSDDDGRTPVLLVTDIGADLDDTLAFLTIAGSPALRLVGVVTSVGDGVARGCVMRGWLRRLGYADGEVPVLPSVDTATAGVVAPPGTPAPADAALGAVADTPRAIVAIARAYGARLAIVGIAALTPIAAALREPGGRDALRGVGRLYLQGQCVVAEPAGAGAAGGCGCCLDGAAGALAPDSAAYNFRTDMAAAAEVLDALQDAVPMRFLGKFAAYAVGVTKDELGTLDRAVGAAPSCAPARALPSMREMAKAQMDGFRQGNPALFFKIYAVPEQHRSLQTHAWYDHLPEGVISHPYDPLLALALVEEVEADAKRAKPSSLTSTIRRPPPPPLFDRRAVGEPTHDGARHTTIGNAPDACGVVDVELTKRALVAAMNRGVDRFGRFGSSVC